MIIAGLKEFKREKKRGTEARPKLVKGATSNSYEAARTAQGEWARGEKRLSHPVACRDLAALMAYSVMALFQRFEMICQTFRLLLIDIRPQFIKLGVFHIGI
jgi:hypothetical protein